MLSFQLFNYNILKFSYIFYITSIFNFSVIFDKCHFYLNNNSNDLL